MCACKCLQGLVGFHVDTVTAQENIIYGYVGAQTQTNVVTYRCTVTAAVYGPYRDRFGLCTGQMDVCLAGVGTECVKRIC